MERDTNPFWEHPMVPGARGRGEAGGRSPERPEPEPDSPTNDFGVAVSIPKFTAVRRAPWPPEENDTEDTAESEDTADTPEVFPQPVRPVEPYQQQQWSGGWRDFLDAQSEPEPAAEEYRDEFDEMLLPRPERRRRPWEWEWRVPRRAIAVACWVGLICLLVGFILVAFDYASPTAKNRSAPPAAARHPAPAAAAPSSTPPSAASPTSSSSSLLPGPNATPGCLDSNAGDTATGTGVGGTGSGPNAILWFEHSYYVERSAARARQAVAPFARVAALDHLQHGIDSVPLGTTYCVHITPGSPQSSDIDAANARQWHVEITEQRPGEDSYVIDQTISTITSDDGTVLITGIVAVE